MQALGQAEELGVTGDDHPASVEPRSAR
jgi:hypothetical protein